MLAQQFGPHLAMLLNTGVPLIINIVQHPRNPPLLLILAKLTRIGAHCRLNRQPMLHQPLILVPLGEEPIRLISIQCHQILLAIT